MYIKKGILLVVEFFNESQKKSIHGIVNYINVTLLSKNNPLSIVYAH